MLILQLCLFLLQSDVDNDLVGDSCDTNQDRYAVREASPELKHAADSWRAVIREASLDIIPERCYFKNSVRIY